MTDLWEPVGGVFWKVAPTLTSFDFVENFEWFAFFMTIVGTLVGAGFGARYGAKSTHSIAHRAKSQDELLREIRSCNVGLSLASFTFDVAIVVHQLAKPLRDKYEDALQAHSEALSKGAPIPTALLDVRDVSLAMPPIGALTKIVYEDITAPTKALRAMMSLSQSLEQTNDAIESRNALLENFRNNKFPEGFGFIDMYFGLPINGIAHRNYRDNIVNLSEASDKLLFLSERLCLELYEHACALRARLKNFSKEPVTLRKFILGPEAEAQQVLIREKFKDWAKAYAPAEKETRRRWWRWRHK